MRRFASIAFGLIVTLVACSARAQSSYSLTWERSASATSCLGVGELRAAVERLLGQELAAGDDGDTRVRGRMTRDVSTQRWQAALELLQAGVVVGQRSFESPAESCHDLDDTLSLSIALMLDPDAVLSAEPPEAVEPSNRDEMPAEVLVEPSSADSSSTAPVMPVDVASNDATPESPNELDVDDESGAGAGDEGSGVPGESGETGIGGDTGRRWRLEVLGSGVLALGKTAPLSFGGVGAFSFDPPRFWPVEVGLGGLGSPTVNGEGGRAEVSGLDVHLGLCPDFVERGRFRFSGCAFATLGWLFASGKGLSTNREAQATTFSILLSLRVRLRLWRALGATLGVGMVVPAIRPRVVYLDDDGELVNIYRPPPIAFSVDLGFSLDFFS